MFKVGDEVYYINDLGKKVIGVIQRIEDPIYFAKYKMIFSLWGRKVGTGWMPSTQVYLLKKATTSHLPSYL